MKLACLLWFLFYRFNLLICWHGIIIHNKLFGKGRNMDKGTMRNRLSELSSENDLTKLMDLTIYNVNRALTKNSQNNYQIEYYIKESYKDNPPKTKHYLFRSYDADALELFSILIRMEVDEDEAMKEFLPE